MELNRLREFTKRAKDNKEYDYICNTFWQMSKEELAFIVKAYIRNIENSKNKTEITSKVCNDIIKEVGTEDNF